MERKTPFVEICVDGRVLLKKILKSRMGECGLDSSGSGQRLVAGSDVNGNEISDTKKSGNLLINRLIIKTTFSGHYPFLLNLHWTELQFSDFCCNNGSPDGRTDQVELTDRMVYQRHADGFFVFPVCGVWFNLRDLCFFPK
jgi:hypothetical protein